MQTLDTVLTTVRNSGLELREKARYWQVVNPENPRGKALYIPKQKSPRRIDVSGFTLFHDAVRPLAKKNGRVTGQIHMSLENATDALEKALELVSDMTVQGNKIGL